jgi:4'-phosphopantetheinyl transferase EntD
MALSAIIESTAGKIGIWELTESASALLHLSSLSDREKNEFSLLNNEKRKKEYLAVRLLLKCMLAGNNEIIYNDAGKPFLKDLSLNISISHSDDLVVIMISDKNTGIDAEPSKRDVKKIAARMLTGQELADSSGKKDENIIQLLYWCAKEAAFKLVSEEKINFKTDIKIDSFGFKKGKGEFYGRYQKNDISVNLSFRYFFHKNNVIVYCVT